MKGVGRARPAVLRRSSAGLALVLVAALAGAWASVAWQPSGWGRADSNSRLVVLARLPDADAITVEALSRVSGELVAAGFHIRALPIPRDADARSTVESIGRELDPVAAFAIFPGPPASGSLPTAEIWVSDRIEGRATVQRLLVDPEDANRRAAVLAVHAVELLKASLAELWVDASARATAVASETPIEPAAPVHQRGRSLLKGFSVEAAGGVLAHPSGFSMGWTPAVRLAIGGDSGWAARVTAVGAGQIVDIPGAAGTAHLRQQMVSVDGILTFRMGMRVQPLLSVTAGTYRLGVSGTGTAPMFSDRSDQTWAFMAGVGGGVVVGLADHLALGADVQALGFLPRPVVRLGDVEAGQAGLPALLVTAGVIGTF